MRLWPFRNVRPTQQAPVSFAELRALSSEQLREIFAAPPAISARWIRAAARYGLVEAQLLLGQMKLDGNGVPRDPAAAVGWFAAAAGAGHVPAINMLGRCHEHGWGTKSDPAKAAELYRRAAEAGDDWAQVNLAHLLLRGRGVARDRDEALSWFTKAARQGNAKAMNVIGRSLEEGWNGPPDPGRAVHWYRAAAEGGDFRAQYNLATLLVQIGDLPAAVNWFDKSLETANPDIIAAAVTQLGEHPAPELRQVAARARALSAVPVERLPGLAPAS